MNEIQICKKCNQNKNKIEDFDIIKSSGNYKPICKKCEYEREKLLRIQYKKICEQNKDLTKYCIKCRQERLLIEFKFHSRICKDCEYVNDISKRNEFRNKNKELIKKQRLEFKRKHYKRLLLSYAKIRAKKKNIPFNIDESDIIVPNKCPVLGIKIEYSENNSKDCSPSLDKIIPDKGYVKDNIAVISWRANSIKNSGNSIEHAKIAIYIQEHIIEDYSI